MPVNAVRLRRLLCSVADAAQAIHLLRYGFKVFRVNAAPVTAQMVDFQAGRNFAFVLAV